MLSTNFLVFLVATSFNSICASHLKWQHASHRLMKMLFLRLSFSVKLIIFSITWLLLIQKLKIQKEKKNMFVNYFTYHYSMSKSIIFNMFLLFYIRYCKQLIVHALQYTLSSLSALYSFILSSLICVNQASKGNCSLHSHRVVGIFNVEGWKMFRQWANNLMGFIFKNNT